MKAPIKDLVRWATYLARLSRRPRTFRVRPGREEFNKEQECARRRLFFKVHGTAIGGGEIWPE